MKPIHLNPKLVVRIVVWAVLFGAGLLGLTALRRQQVLAEREAAAANWMPLSAKVLSATVKPIEHRRPLGPQFTRRINYGYAVDGVQYTNTRYSFVGDQSFSTRAEAETAKPAVGDFIEIRFDPAQPSDAIVERASTYSPDAPRFKYGLIGLSLAEGILLITAVRFVRRARRRYAPARRRGRVEPVVPTG